MSSTSHVREERENYGPAPVRQGACPYKESHHTRAFESSRNAAPATPVRFSLYPRGSIWPEVLKIEGVDGEIKVNDVVEIRGGIYGEVIGLNREGQLNYRQQDGSVVFSTVEKVVRKLDEKEMQE